MNVDELRLECLKLALSNEPPAIGVNAERAVKAAEIFAAFILPTPHTPPRDILETT
jgi:hypothetical protein